MNIGTLGQLIIIMLLWSACFPLIIVGIEFAPHLSFAFLRAIVAGGTLTAVALALRKPLPNSATTWVTIAATGIGATSLGFLGMFHAAEFISPGIATVIANSQPLLAAVVAQFVLDERLTERGKMGLFFGFAGIVFIAAPHVAISGDNFIRGLLFIVLAAVGLLVSNVLIKRIAGKVDPLMATGLQLLIGSIPLAIGALATEEPDRIQWSPVFIGVLLFLSVIGTGVVYWLWFSVLAKIPLNQANTFTFLVPIFGLGMGMLFFGEVLNWLQFAGAALAVVGVSLVARHGTVIEPIR